MPGVAILYPAVRGRTLIDVKPFPPQVRARLRAGGLQHPPPPLSSYHFEINRKKAHANWRSELRIR
jgi:hypothetical protein